MTDFFRFMLNVMAKLLMMWFTTKTCLTNNIVSVNSFHMQLLLKFYLLHQLYYCCC